MKYSIIFTTVITLALTSQLVTAGSITDAYTSGDTLTATKMDNIKTAVNDNDNSIGTNTTNIGINASDIGAFDTRITQNESDISTLDSSKSVAAHNRTVCGTTIFTGCPADILTTTTSTVASVTINVPSPGRVIVSFSGQYNINHSNTVTDRFCIELGTSSSASPFPPCNGTLSILSPIGASQRLVTVPSTVLTDSYSGGIHTQQVFIVTTAGSHTFFLRGQSNNTGSTIQLRQSNMIAYFIAD